MSSAPSQSFRKLLALRLPPVTISRRIWYVIQLITIALVIFAVSWLPLREAALLVGGTIFLTLLLIKPVLGLYVLIIAIPFSSLLALSGGGFRAGIMELTLALASTAWLLRLLACHHLPGQSPVIRTGPLLLPFLIVLGGISLSWLNTLSIRASLIETAKWVEMLILYLLIINLMPVRHIKWAILVIIAAGLAQTALGLYQFIFKVGPPGFLLFDGRFLRAYGTFAQPNPYAGYLGLVLPLTLALTLWSFERWPRAWYPGRISSAGVTRWEESTLRVVQGLFRFVILALPLGLLLAALFASQSRGAWLGFIAGSLAIWAVYSKKSAMLLAVAIFAGALLALVSSFEPGSSPNTQAAQAENSYTAVVQRFSESISTITVIDVANTPVTDANFATIERLAHWQAAREMWRDHPWLGVGIGNYEVIYPAYAVGPWLDPLGHAHNYLLNIGAETGLIGITAYLIFWIFSFGLLWTAVRHSSGFHRAVAAGIVGIVVHLHIHNLVDNLYVQGMYLHISFVLGLATLIYLASSNPNTERA